MALPVRYALCIRTAHLIYLTGRGECIALHCIALHCIAGGLLNSLRTIAAGVTVSHSSSSQTVRYQHSPYNNHRMFGMNERIYGEFVMNVWGCCCCCCCCCCCVQVTQWQQVGALCLPNRTNPFDTGCLPLNHSGNPGVNTVSHRGGGVGAHRKAHSPIPAVRYGVQCVFL
jgi:hypothetical protein